jgi:HlyD family secretion protein
MTRGRKLFVGVGLGAGLIGAALYGLSTAMGAGSTIDPARIATVERGTMVRSVVATGAIEPITKVEIKSKANGIIEALRVDIGDVVKPGDILVELDKENLRARLREARANLAAAEASLQAAEAELAKNQIEAEGPDVEFAKRAFERAQNLFDQKLIAQSGLDEARSTLDTAQNRQRAAQSHLSVTRAKVSQMRANIAQAAANVERAEEELANATIRAPIG